MFKNTIFRRLTALVLTLALAAAAALPGLAVYPMPCLLYTSYTFLFPGQYANVMGYAIVVSVSLFFSVILAKLVGGMLPLAAKKDVYKRQP